MMTHQKVRELGWEVVIYLPYSPKLVSSDYHHCLDDVMPHIYQC
uniref:Uncharacterized protein n=1 Tax=Lepeophtheirus salmonis TaxID=72036 RepID=A0A0K2T3Q3_LEPSM